MKMAKDINGVPIMEGDRVAIAVVSGRSSAELRVVTVKRIEQTPATQWLIYDHPGRWNSPPHEHRTKRFDAMLVLP